MRCRKAVGFAVTDIGLFYGRNLGKAVFVDEDVTGGVALVVDTGKTGGGFAGKEEKKKTTRRSRRKAAPAAEAPAAEAPVAEAPAAEAPAAE